MRNYVDHENCEHVGTTLYNRYTAAANTTTAITATVTVNIATKKHLFPHVYNYI